MALDGHFSSSNLNYFGNSFSVIGDEVFIGTGANTDYKNKGEVFCYTIPGLNLYSITDGLLPEDQAFLVYPNPANDWLHIEVLYSDKAKLTIRNDSGQLILTKEFFNELNLEVSTFVQGNYYISIETGQTKVTRQVVVIH